MNQIDNDNKAMLLTKFPEFIEYLHAAGYRISTAEFTSAQRVLRSLESIQIAQWPLWLAPVLCHSPVEQENFANYFTLWLETQGFNETASQKTPREPKKEQFWQKRITALGLLLAILVLAMTYWLNREKMPAGSEQRVLSVTVKAMPTKKLLTALAWDMGVTVQFHPTLNDTNTVTLAVSNKTFSQLLQTIAQQANIHYQFVETQLQVLPGPKPSSLNDWLGYAMAGVLLILSLGINLPFGRIISNKLRLPSLKSTTIPQPTEIVSQPPALNFEKAVYTVLDSNPRLEPYIPKPLPLMWDTVSMTSASVTDSPAELIIALYIVARNKRGFAGIDIFTILDDLKFEYGEMTIFHCYHLGELRVKQPVFSIANLREPGTFNNIRSETFTTPGLALFMRLPGPFDGQVAFELLLNTSYRLAEILEGQIEDKQHRPLTAESVAVLRERVTRFVELNS